MLFNSHEFGVFFLIAYSLYLLLQEQVTLQNKMLLIASCIFYGWWDWRFLCLMLCTAGIDYWCALKIDETPEPGRRRFFLFISLLSNLGTLAIFKYFGFFASNFTRLLGALGIHFNPVLIHIVLPVGISFYTFQALSYTIDVYRREIKPVRNYFDFNLYVTFFPQLVAGPIERATHLIPQVVSKRTLQWEQICQGAHLILWGLFQKIYIADNLAPLVNKVFNAAPPYQGASVLIATYAFAFQILCDFSGYSNIARGLGKMMGFDIMVNFNLPYFSTNPSEFWRRWHISLSTWLRDYLYIPLGGNKKGEWMTYRNLALTMFLGGLWHGAAWTFIAWGIYHGLLLIGHRLMMGRKKGEPVKQESLKNPWFWMKAIFFFHLICISWIFFRANSLSQAFMLLGSIPFNFATIGPEVLDLIRFNVIMAFLSILIVQTLQYIKNDLMILYKQPLPILALIHALMLYLMLRTPYVKQEFIYFQF